MCSVRKTGDGVHVGRSLGENAMNSQTTVRRLARAAIMIAAGVALERTSVAGGHDPETTLYDCDPTYVYYLANPLFICECESQWF